jgi:hypothetical protein
MVGDTIQLLNKLHFYKAGEFTEIAKGKNEIVTTFKGAKNKIVRIWQSRK